MAAAEPGPAKPSEVIETGKARFSGRFKVAAQQERAAAGTRERASLPFPHNRMPAKNMAATS